MLISTKVIYVASKNVNCIIKKNLAVNAVVKGVIM